MSEELDKIKKTENKLMICGVEREIRFGFSAWAKLEEKYGSLENVEKLEKEMESKPISELRELAWIGLVDKSVYKDGKKMGGQLNQETFLDEYGIQDVKRITEVVMGALYGSLPKTEDGDEDSEKESV